MSIAAIAIPIPLLTSGGRILEAAGQRYGRGLSAGRGRGRTGLAGHEMVTGVIKEGGGHLHHSNLD